MKIYIITSDRYSFLVEGWLGLYDLFWDDPNNEIVVLGFDGKNVPEGVGFVSLGKQEEMKSWSSPLREYFSSVKDEHFFMCFEDHYLVDFVNQDLIEEAISWGGIYPEVDKVFLMVNNSKIDKPYRGNFFLTRDVPNALVTTSLLPAIWRRDWLLHLLEPDVPTPHAFEKLHNQKTLGCTTIQSRAPIYPVIDAVRKGEFSDMVFQEYGRGGNVDLSCLPVFREMRERWCLNK